MVDTRTNTMVGTIPVGRGALDIVLTPDGRRAYVVITSFRRNGAVRIIDTVSETVMNTVPVGIDPGYIAMGPENPPITPFPTATVTASGTVIDTPASTPTPTVTATATVTPLPTHTGTPTVSATATLPPTATPPPCPGDCDRSGEVEIDELVRGVDIALGTRPVADCPAFDRNMDGRVAVDELVRGVKAALDGCEAVAEPTSTPTNTCTPGANPAPGCEFEGPITPTGTPRSATGPALP